MMVFWLVPCGQRMSDHGISAVPILGVGNMVVGVFSSSDVRRFTRHVDVYPSLFQSLREFLVAKVAG